MKLSMDQLKNVTGGVMTEANELYLDETLGFAKRQYKTKEDLIKYVTGNFDTLIDPSRKMTQEEIVDYINSFWDLL